MLVEQDVFEVVDDPRVAADFKGAPYNLHGCGLRQGRDLRGLTRCCTDVRNAGGEHGQPTYY